jgi:hypothetical protein
MKEALKVRLLLSDEINGAVQNRLKTQPKIFFSDGITWKRWNRCVQVESYYVEK